MPAGHDISFAKFIGPPATYYDESTFTLDDTGYWTQFFRLILSGFERASFAGTARMALDDSLNDPSVLRARSPGSVSVNSDELVIEYSRVAFYPDVVDVLVYPSA